MGFICTTEEGYFCKIADYIKSHMCLYCFWHPEVLFNRFYQPLFLYEQRPQTIGWTILQNLSGGLSWGCACMRSQYKNMAWPDFYFSKWSHSLKALIILTEDKYGLPKSQQKKKKKRRKSQILNRQWLSPGGGITCNFHETSIHSLRDPVFLSGAQIGCTWSETALF